MTYPQADTERTSGNGSAREVARASIESPSPSRATSGRDARTEGRHLGTLVRDLVKESEALIRGEAMLAKAEMSERLVKVERGVASMAGGGAVLFAGMLVVLSALVFALGQVMALWLAALLVGGATIIIGAILMAAGKSKASPHNLVPERTLHEAKKSAAFAKEKTR